MVRLPFVGKKPAAAANLNQLQAREAQLLQELNKIQAQIRGLQGEAKTFFEAVKKEKHGFEYEEQILKNFISKLTILIGQLALQFKAVAGFDRSGHIPYDHFSISQYAQIERLSRQFINMYQDFYRDPSRTDFKINDFTYPKHVADIIASYGYLIYSYGRDKTPLSILASRTAQALNDIMWIALQLKELKKLYSREEKWRVAEDDIAENCMKMLSGISVDKDVDFLVHSGSIHKAREALAAKDYYAHFRIDRVVEHDFQQLLGRVNTAEREEEATQNISKEFHYLASRIENIIKLIYQRLIRVYRYNQILIYFLTDLRRVQVLEIDTSKLVEALQSIYSSNERLTHERRLEVWVTMVEIRQIPALVDGYNNQVNKFKTVLERKLALMQVIDRKMRDGFVELNAMINATKAISVLSSEETDLLHQLIVGTKDLEAQLRRARRSPRTKR